MNNMSLYIKGFAKEQIDLIWPLELKKDGKKQFQKLSHCLHKQMPCKAASNLSCNLISVSSPAEFKS